MKNVRLGVKLIGGFVFVTIITILIGIQDHLALDEMEDDLRGITKVEMPSVQAVLNLKVGVQRVRSNTHLILSQFITIEERQNAHEQVELIREDMHTQLELLKSFPVDHQEENTALKEFETALNAWHDANNKILSQSRDLAALGIAQTKVSSDLYRIGAAHHELMSNVGKLILYGVGFEGGTDGEACPFGKWLATFQTSNGDMNALIAKLKPVHRALHESVAVVKKFVEQGQVDEAKMEYRDKTLPTAHQVFDIFSQMLDISNKAQTYYHKMETVFDTEVVALRDAVLKSLDNLAEMNLKSARDEEEHALQNSGVVKMRSGILIFVGSIVSIVIGVILTLGIIRPLRKGVALARSMADGDLTMTMDVRQGDEIGVLADSLNEMVGKLRCMMGEIVTEVGNVSASSSSLASIAEQMTNGATTSVQRASQVAAAAEEMSATQNSVAAAMEQASINVNAVASAAEEMSATIGEIASNSGKAKTITDQAVRQAFQASAHVNELGAAANEINKVTETITAISSQTNLLALNATIEAARAGEAGRGFAVVANEIKELAQQTARATEEIRAKIQGIQQATKQTVVEISEISHVIGDVDAIVATIAAAVEEQSVTTREIADNVGQASTGIVEVNSNVAQSSAVAGEIASDIADVTTQSNETLLASEQVKLSASGLSDTASKLKTFVDRFKLSA